MQAICNVFSEAGHEDVKKMKNVLNKELSSLCQWFVDNKLSRG